MKPIYLFGILLLLLLIAPVSAATTNATSGMTVTCKGAYDILVSLGIENFIPIAQARIYYNWISVLLLVSVAAMASSRTTRFFGILIPVFAALFIYFGWFTMNDPSRPGQLMGVIIVGVVLAVAVYMKGSLHERFGIAGPGSLMFNIVFYMILLQATVGFVNSTHIWGDYAASPTPSNEYTNIDLKSEVTSISSTGGGLTDVAQMGSVMLDMAFGALKMFISMGIAMAAFTVVLGAMYPWIPANPMGAGLLVIIQVGIYIVYYMAFMRMVYKPVGEGDF